MGELLDKVKEYINRLSPSDPIRISVSKLKFILLLIIVIVGSGYFYLRYENAKELELLKEQHRQIKLSVENYFRSMSRANTDSVYIDQIKSEVYKTQRQLNKLEERINELRSFWFLD
ncbi:MAG: hypothetical protein U5K00_21200 [Melioribacteraceae bacterium]|nr:hypothetical protein [Melioribacteraceae bacterium]